MCIGKYKPLQSLNITVIIISCIRMLCAKDKWLGKTWQSVGIVYGYVVDHVMGDMGSFVLQDSSFQAGITKIYQIWNKEIMASNHHLYAERKQRGRITLWYVIWDLSW